MNEFNHYRQRLTEKVARILQKTGMSNPRQLALTFAAGTTIGLMPIPWGTMIVCVVIAWVMKLNQLAIQAFNYLVYPLQIVLMPLFFWTGDHLLSEAPIFTSIASLRHTLEQSPTELFNSLGTAFFYGLLLWGCLIPVLAPLLYWAGYRLATRSLPSASKDLSC